MRAGVGGLQAIHMLREVDPGVRAIVSSGYSDEVFMANFADNGFRASLAKPYTGKDLRASLALAMSRARVIAPVAVVQLALPPAPCRQRSASE